MEFTTSDMIKVNFTVPSSGIAALIAECTDASAYQRTIVTHINVTKTTLNGDQVANIVMNQHANDA
jgi:hypothetical protein